MINEFKIEYLRNSLLTDEMVKKIIELKKQYWNYPIEAHEKWMKENIYDDEYHLLIESNNEELLAYLNIVTLTIKLDNKYEEVRGIGNVCVNNQISNNGVGVLLMNICNYYIRNNKKRAILLCKKRLLNFYQKSGWKLFEGAVVFQGNNYDELVMFSDLPNAMNIEIERNF